MKRIGVLIIIAILACMSCAFAEGTEITLYEAFDELGKVAEKVLMIYSTTEDEEVKTILEKNLVSIANAQAGMMLIDADAYTSNEYEQEVQAIDGEAPDKFYDSGKKYVDELMEIKNYQLSVQKRIIEFQDDTYNADEELAGRTQIKMATREETNEALLFLSIYEEKGYLSSTGRFLIHDNNGISRCLYTRTLGEVLEVNLDLEKWVAGEDIKWNKALLFP